MKDAAAGGQERQAERLGDALQPHHTQPPHPHPNPSPGGRGA